MKYKVKYQYNSVDAHEMISMVFIWIILHRLKETRTRRDKHKMIEMTTTETCRKCENVLSSRGFQYYTYIQLLESEQDKHKHAVNINAKIPKIYQAKHTK